MRGAGSGDCGSTEEGHVNRSGMVSKSLLEEETSLLNLVVR